MPNVMKYTEMIQPELYSRTNPTWKKKPGHSEFLEVKLRQKPFRGAWRACSQGFLYILLQWAASPFPGKRTGMDVAHVTPFQSLDRLH